MTQQEWLEDPECCTSERIQILLKAVRKHNGNYRKMKDETLLQQILDGGTLGTGISFQEFAWILEKKDYEGLGEEFSETIADLRPDFLTDFIQTPRVVDLCLETEARTRTGKSKGIGEIYCQIHQRTDDHRKKLLRLHLEILKEDTQCKKFDDRLNQMIDDLIAKI